MANFNKIYDSLNSYSLKNEKFFIKVGVTVYRGIQAPYSCLLPYERAKGEIIILSGFTSTSEKIEKAEFFAGRKNPSNIYNKKLLFSVIFYIHNS